MERERLDLSSDPQSQKTGSTNAAKMNNQRDEQGKKKFLGIKFTCCGMYARIYVNKDGTAYEGRCPKCLKPIKLKIGEGGTDNRFFEVY